MSGKYIVVFKDGVTPAQIQKYADQVGKSGGEVVHRFESTLNGFSAVIPDSFLGELQSLQGDVIRYIEPDGVVTTQ